MRITVNDFINNRNFTLRKCNSGHITNGAWMVLEQFMPKGFRDKVKTNIDTDGEPDGQSILDGMNGKEFYEVKLINPEDIENDDMSFVTYACNKFQIHFKKQYILYLTKNVKRLKIMVSDPAEPAKLVQSGLTGDKEFGLLMGCRI